MTGAGNADVVEISDTTVRLADGRKVAVWRTGPATPVEPRRIAIVAPGFARRMRHTAAIARYLVDNGFVVYRCDYANHVGLSDGDIWNFTIGATYDSLLALHEHALETEQTQDVVFIASSLSARTCFRLAAQRSGISGIAALVGVVDTRYTLERVFEFDHGARHPAEIGDEEFVSFEGKRIQSRPFSENWRDGGWLNVEDTELDLARAGCPVVNFCGSSDDWIDIAEVRRVFALGDSSRRVVELPFVEHELSRNPVAAQTILRELTRCALEFTGAADGVEIVETPFTSLAAQIPYERKFETSHEGHLRDFPEL